MNAIEGITPDRREQREETQEIARSLGRILGFGPRSPRRVVQRDELLEDRLRRLREEFDPSRS